MEELENGCTDPILLEWEKKVWDYDQVHSSMMSREYFEILERFSDEALICYRFDMEKYLGISEHFSFDFKYDRDTNIMVFLMTNCEYAILLDQHLDPEINKMFGVELFGIIKISELWAYMDSLPNIKKRLLPFDRMY